MYQLPSLGSPRASTMVVSEPEAALSTMAAGAAETRATTPERRTVVLMMEAGARRVVPLDGCVDENG
jgi:hypothetical protein